VVEVREAAAAPSATPAVAPIHRVAVTDEVVKRIVDLILHVGLKPGDRLPAERKLSVMLGVGHTTLREALKLLSAVGLVRVSVGHGTFVGSGESSLLASRVSWGVLMGEHSTHELMETRRAIELEVAGLASDRGTDEEIDLIGQRLEQMRASLADAEVFGRFDLEFHLAVSQAAHNRVLHRVLETVRQLLQVGILETTREYGDQRQTIEAHTAVYDAIRARDAFAARLAMSAHLDVVEAQLLELVGRTTRPA
jgi:GntR family transcriptional regulator, transcriptional repressor for pyruvate dehydrogenase complex